MLLHTQFNLKRGWQTKQKFDAVLFCRSKQALMPLSTSDVAARGPLPADETRCSFEQLREATPAARA